MLIKFSQETLTKKTGFSSETLTRTLLTPPKQRIIADVNMRKTVKVTILISTILLTMVAGTQFVKAYPPYERDAESLIKISISSPENNELYNFPYFEKCYIP
jgi:hypothetical protein